MSAGEQKTAPAADRSKEAAAQKEPRKPQPPQTKKGGKPNGTNHHPEPATRSTDETTLQAAEPPKARMKPSHPR